MERGILESTLWFVTLQSAIGFPALVDCFMQKARNSIFRETLIILNKYTI